MIRFLYYSLSYTACDHCVSRRALLMACARYFTFFLLTPAMLILPDFSR
jgi:hypothetical protein